MVDIAFFSTCPACKHVRLQNGYTQAELTAALDSDHAIDAYCLMCDVVWPISAQERFQIAALLAADQQGASQTPPGAAKRPRAPEC